MYKNSRDRVLLEKHSKCGSWLLSCRCVKSANTFYWQELWITSGTDQGVLTLHFFTRTLFKLTRADRQRVKADREQFSAATIRQVQVVMATEWSDNPILVGQSCFVTQHYLNNITETKRAAGPFECEARNFI